MPEHRSPCRRGSTLDGQGVAVRSKSRRGQSDQCVALSNSLGTEFLAPLNHTHGEPATSRSSGAITPPCSAVSPPSSAVHACRHPLAMPATNSSSRPGNQVCQRRRSRARRAVRADAREVVNQHRHQVDTHRVVAPNLTRDLKLGAHAVGGGDEHWLFVLRGVEREEAAKATNAARTSGRFRTGNDILDSANCLVTASIDTPALA